MRISTDLGPEFSGEQLAHFVKCAIEGFALGSVPMAGVWKLPPLYESGIRFQREPAHGTGNEDFALPNVCFGRRWGDCDDLVIYRIWELRVLGEPATCVSFFQDSELHVAVRRWRKQGQTWRPTSTVEDPSILLGARSK